MVIIKFGHSSMVRLLGIQSSTVLSHFCVTEVKSPIHLGSIISKILQKSREMSLSRNGLRVLVGAGNGSKVRTIKTKMIQSFQKLIFSNNSCTFMISVFKYNVVEEILAFLLMIFLLIQSKTSQMCFTYAQKFQARIDSVKKLIKAEQ